MELTAENVTKLLAAIGIEDKVEDVEVDSVVTRATELADRPEKAETDERTLEQRAKDEGKTLVDADELSTLRSDATAGREARDELKQDKFDRAYDTAISDGRLRANDETKARLQKLYAADAEACLEDLASRPKIVNTEPRGSGSSPRNADEAPEGVDAERYELDQEIRAYMDEHDEADYEKAASKVLKARKRAA